VADKTTAAFFIGFPFTKIKRQAKAFVPITRYALSIARLVPSRGTQQKNRKPEICSGQIRNSEPISAFDSGPLISMQATAKFKLG
jgi:hypothetical protein